MSRTSKRRRFYAVKRDARRMRRIEHWLGECTRVIRSMMPPRFGCFRFVLGPNFKRHH
jgi:hypothetical protein